jgi:hypothetical protein
MYAQDPEDALRLSWYTSSGTARSNALGGAMGSLGGDLSSNHINPAGLGFYKSGELLFAPKFSFQSNSLNYLGNKSTSSNTKANIGSFGIVFADGKRKRNWTSSAFAITFNQIADYNNHISFSGNNNFSSYSEKYLEELVNDRADTLSALNNYIFGSSLAFRTYLVDTTAGPKGVVTGYQSLVPISTGVNQKYDATTSGSYNELAFGWGGNVEDKLYLGASIIMPMINYNRTIIYSESDLPINNVVNTNNDFAYFQNIENFASRGWGLGAKFGIIYKLEPYLRLGFSIHTPQVITFRDAINATMTANLDNYVSPKHGEITVSSSALNNGFDGIREYTIATPAKATISTSYFFAAPNKPSQPLGFVSADIEFVNYSGARYYSNTYDQESADYYRALNTTIKAIYKDNVNIKVGSEIKVNGNWMVRAGTSYYGSPYKDETIKAAQWTVSGGIGYRTNKHFIDLTIVNTAVKDAIFPYRLNDKPNTYASYTGNRLMFNIGYGIRF